MAKTEKLNAIDNATKTLNELEGRRAELTEAGKVDETSLANLSYEACSGNQKAVAALEALRERERRRLEELNTLDVAIKVARERVAVARAEEVSAEQKRAAEEAREIVDRIDALFASADKHFKLAFDALKAADGRIEELHRLGFAFPTAIQVRTNALFALQSYFMALPKYWWNELSHSGVQFLAPGQRRTFSQFWSRMVEPISRNIGARLNETKTEKEKVA